MRTKSALKNIIAASVYELVSIICNFIVPRLILSTFGSTYNGITNSITQFLGVVSLMKAGIEGVTIAALYKPLADSDYRQVSAVLKATEKFLRKIAVIFTVFLVSFAAVYPVLVNQEFDWLFSSSLVIILGLATIAQYCLGLTYQALLFADQKRYIPVIVNIFTIVLNTIVSAVLIKAGAGIHAVKLGSSFVYILNPVIIYVYAHKKYPIVKDVASDTNSISQRWDAFGMQVALFVHSNVDVALLTIFTTLKDVSVYSVYFLVTNGVYMLLKSSVNGIDAAFGNMMAKNDEKALKTNFRIYELVVFSVATVLFSTALLSILQFVQVYTAGINDYNYIQPAFAILLTIATYFNCLRIPYQNVTEAAGRFKETKKGAYIEAIINLTVSIIFVRRFGLVGVAVGTLVANIYRTVFYGFYFSKNILNRNFWIIAYRVAVYVIAGLVIVLIGKAATSAFVVNNFVQWAIFAFVNFMIAAVVIIIVDLLIYRNDLFGFSRKIKGVFKHKGDRRNEVVE